MNFITKYMHATRRSGPFQAKDSHFVFKAFLIETFCSLSEKFSTFSSSALAMVNQVFLYDNFGILVDFNVPRGAKDSATRGKVGDLISI